MKCKEDAGDINYYCCKKIQNPSKSLNEQSIETATEVSDLNKSEGQTTLSYSNKYLLKDTLSPSQDSFVTGSDFSVHQRLFENQKIINANPYKDNEQPIQLIKNEHISSIPPTTTPQYSQPDEISMESRPTLISETEAYDEAKIEQTTNEPPMTMTIPDITIESNQMNYTRTETEPQIITPQSPYNKSQSLVLTQLLDENTPEPTAVAVAKMVAESVQLKQYRYFSLQRVKPLVQFYEPPHLSSEGENIPQEKLFSIPDNTSNTKASVDLQIPISIFATPCENNMKCVLAINCEEKRPRNNRVECLLKEHQAIGVCCLLATEHASKFSAKLLSLHLQPTVSTRLISPGDVSGVNSEHSRQIIDSKSKFPWHVLLRSGGKECNGAIISPRVIATTASCVQNVTIDQLEIQIDERSKNSNPQGVSDQNIQVGTIIKHPKYRTGQLSYNLALVLTEKIINFDHYNKIIYLPHPSEIFNATSYITTETEFIDGSNQKKSRLIETPIISAGACEKTLYESCPGVCIGKTTLCSAAVKCASCVAQDGEPLFVKTERSGKYTLAGLATNNDDFGCSNSELSVYTNILPLVEWISNFISKNPDDVITYQKSLKNRPK